MARARFLLLLGVLGLEGIGAGLALTGTNRAHADGAKEHELVNWKDEAAYKAIQAEEAKSLALLMRTAVKEDFRRQAWFLADRVLAAKPDDREAQGVLEKWSDDELMLGMPPGAEFAKKVEKAFQELGDKYVRFGETIEAAGLDSKHFYELHVLAHSYGSKAPQLLAALQNAGYAWLGTLHDLEQKELTETYGPGWTEIVCPPMWDDGYLEVKVRWPEARVAQVGTWKLMTDVKPIEAVRLLGTLRAAEAHLADLLGGHPAPDDTTTDVLLFAEVPTFDRVAPLFLHASVHEEARARCSWYDARERRVFASWRHRENAWIGEDARMLHAAAQVIARRRLGQGFAGGVAGRGSWLLDGLGGALEGLVVDPKTREPSLEPARCWRLAAAKALRAGELLLAWDKLPDVDREKAKAWPRRTVEVAFRGGKFEARDVDVAAAQATAFVVGLMKADKGKGAKRLGALVGDLLKRDSLPDLDKALGWKKGRWQAEAEKAIDAATGM